jgi:TRAP-type mannitol/chloroaromatic compound transport system permease small subunit
MMTWATGKYALNSLAMGQGSGTPWNPPIYPIKLALAFGFLILVVQGTAKFIRDLYFMTTGNKL